MERLLCLYFTMLLPPLPLSELERDISWLFIMRKWQDSPRDNPQKCGSHPQDHVPKEFLILKLVHTQPEEIYQNYNLNVSNNLWYLLLLQESRSHLWLSGFTYLFRFLGSSLPCDISSLMGSRKAVDVQFFQLVFC